MLMFSLVVVMVALLTIVQAGVFPKSSLVRVTLDDSDVIAPGTPFAKPKIANSVVDLIGGTPLVKLNRLAEGVKANIWLKMESMEPCNSVKDRIGRSMIEEAEKKGLIFPGKTVLVEPTSGNTGKDVSILNHPRRYTVLIFYCMQQVLDWRWWRLRRATSSS